MNELKDEGTLSEYLGYFLERVYRLHGIRIQSMEVKWWYEGYIQKNAATITAATEQRP